MECVLIILHILVPCSQRKLLSIWNISSTLHRQHKGTTVIMSKGMPQKLKLRFALSIVHMISRKIRALRNRSYHLPELLDIKTKLVGTYEEKNENNNNIKKELEARFSN